MIIKGRAFKFGDDISTDHIIPGRYYHLRSNLPELTKHTLEDADPDFMKNFKKGDLVVAGKNFGLGSSREHAAIVLKMAGVSAVLAKTFARIFFRNAINVGLPVVICDTDRIDDRDELEIDLYKGVVNNKTQGIELKATQIPEEVLNILKEGGLVPYIKKYGDFKVT